MCVEATGTLVFYFNRHEGLYTLFLICLKQALLLCFSLMAFWLSSIARTGRIAFACLLRTGSAQCYLGEVYKDYNVSNSEQSSNVKSSLKWSIKWENTDLESYYNIDCMIQSENCLLFLVRFVN